MSSFLHHFFQIRVWSRKDAVESTSLALSVAENVLNYYEEFFNIPYPLPKMGKLTFSRQHYILKMCAN